MQYLRSCQFLVLQLALRLTAAAPLESRAINCLDASAPYDETCWATLDLTSWVSNWKSTAPTCSDADDGAHCCYPSSALNEPWTACFLRLALASSDYNCNVFNGDSCALAGFELASDLNLDATSAAQYRYVVRNIYGNTKGPISVKPADIVEAINNLFNTWYTSFNYALTQSTLIIPSIINQIDPDKKTGFRLTDLLTALGAGLSFLALPELAAGLSTILASTTIAGVVNTALQQAPNVAKAMWPSGTESTKSIQIGDLDIQLLALTSDLTQMLNNGVQVVMSDLPSFLGFASTGAFSSNDVPSIPAETEGMDLALKTFLLTTAMTANGLGVGIQTLATSAAWLETSPDVSQACTLDANNRCGDYYWSTTYSQAFEISPMTDSAPNVAGLMSWIENTSGATLSSVFDAAYKCTRDYGNSENGDILSDEGGSLSSLVNFGTDEKLDLSCLSQIRMTVTCGFPCPGNFRNGECPFVVVGGDPCEQPVKQCGESIPYWLGGSVPLNQQCT